MVEAADATTPPPVPLTTGFQLDGWRLREAIKVNGIYKAMTHADQPGFGAISDEPRQSRRSGTCAGLKALSARLEKNLAAADRAAQREEKRPLLLHTR